MVGAKSKFSLHDSQDASTIHPVWFLLRYQVDLKNQPGVPFNRRPLLQRLQRPDVQHRGRSDEYRWFKPLVPQLRSRNHYAAAFGGGVVGQLWLIADLKQQTVFMASWFLGVGPPSFWFLCSKMPNTLCLLDCTELCWRCGSAYH